LYSSSVVADAAPQQTNTSPPLSTLVYRSRAVAPQSFEDLQQITRTAQARNHREAVTGVLLHDDSSFFQWLEGPADGVERVMRSIRGDPRHTEVEVLDRRPSSARRFDGWDMKLAARGAASARWDGEVLEPPPGIVEDLRRRPAAAPDLLGKLVPPPTGPAAGDSPLAASLVGSALGRSTASVLKSVVLEAVIPRLLHGHGLPAMEAGQLRANPRAPELAELLVASDQAASLDLIRELRGRDGDARRLYAPLFEPAARSLGDLWGDDLCSEFDVALGLCRLQTAVRLLGADAPRAVFRGVQPNVLVAPVPGEPHQLAGALDSEWLWNAGWAPRFEFPADDRALADLVSGAWIDVLDLSLSAAFRRAESLPRLARTIAHARRASRNPALVVVVGGRAFAEAGAAGPDVGADLASKTSRNVDRLMLRGMRMDTAGRPDPAIGPRP
jgi:hypothetical protein